MKKRLLAVFLVFGALTGIVSASEPADTLITDTDRNERIDQHLDSVFGKWEDSSVVTERKNRKSQLPDPASVSSDKEDSASKLQHHILKISGGLSLLTSKVEIGEDVYQNSLGIECLVEFEDLDEKSSDLAKGVAYTFKGNRTVVDGNDMQLYYAGLSYVWSTIPNISHRWRWEFALGGGLCLYRSPKQKNLYTITYTKENYCGLGVLLKAGGEYRLSKRIGLGLELNEILHILFDEETKARNTKTILNGFATNSLTLGLRFYL